MTADIIKTSSSIIYKTSAPVITATVSLMNICNNTDMMPITDAHISFQLISFITVHLLCRIPIAKCQKGVHGNLVSGITVCVQFDGISVMHY